MKIRLVSNLPGSNSLKALAKELTTRLGYKVFRSKVPKPNRKNIIYGTEDCCKIKQYKWFQQNNVPALEFTCNKQDALTWINEGSTVFARLTTKGSEGKGIVIAETPEQLPVAPVYTKYRKKKREFRVHVFRGKVVQVLEKRKRAGFEGDRETKIRNLANGYVFCSENIQEPPGLRELALIASNVSSSDFKGVDIGFNEKKNELFVIEVNSRPGIQGTNVQRYCDIIVNEINN